MRTLTLAALIALIAGFLVTVDWSPYIHNPWMIRDYVLLYPLWTPVAFFLVHTFAELFLLPGGPFTVAGGLLLGTFWGSVLSLFSGQLAAVIIFGITRYSGEESILHYLHNRFAAMRRYNDILLGNGLWHVTLLRLAPFMPANVINIGYGLTKVSFKDFFWGSLIGNIPSTIVMSWLGERFLSWGPRLVISVIIWIMVAGAIAALLYRGYLRRHEKNV